MNENNNPSSSVPNENQVAPGTVVGASANPQPSAQEIPVNDSQGQTLDGPILSDDALTDMPKVTTQSTIYGGGNKFLSEHSKKRIISVSLVALTLLVGAIGLVVSQVLKGNEKPADPLTSISSEKLQGISEQNPDDTSQLTVNSPLLVNSKLVVTPSAPPTTSQAGEIYFNADTKRFVYYDGGSYQDIVNGQEFSQLSALSRATAGTGLNLVGGVLNNGGVLSLQGQTGDISFSGGAGITLNGTQISNSGVLSIQGVTGNVSFTAGNGVSLNGLTITNTGVTALNGSTNQVIVSASNGAVTLSLPQNIGTASTPTFGGLTLTSSLGVGSGGTGSTAGAFSNKGVVYFNGASLVSTGAPGSNGLCLISTASGPAFGSCTGSAQVTSVNGLTGGVTLAAGSGINIADNGTDTITITALAASGVTSLQGATSGAALNGVLTVNNAKTAGSAITIDDASTSAKGIAKFNSTDFSVTSGNVSLNTVDVSKGGTGKTTFGTNTVLLGNGNSGITELTAGTNGQCLLIQDDAPVFATCTGAGGVSSINSKSNAVTIQGGTAISIDDTGADIVVNNTGVTELQGTANQISLTASTGSITLSLPQDIALTSNVTFNQVTLGLNGSSAGKVVFSGGTANSVTLQAPDSPTNGLTFTLPVADGATGECLSTNGSGALSFKSCVGGGSGGGISGSGNTNKLAKFTGGQAIGDSSITDDGSLVTITVNAAIQGSGGLLIGAPSVAGVLNLSDGSSNTTQLKSASLSSDVVFTLPSTTGSNGECIKTNGSGVLSFGACLSGGTGSGVNSLIGDTNGVSATGDVTIANTTATGSTITIDNASNTAKGIASFSSSNFSVSDGAVSIAANGITLGNHTSGNYVASIVAGSGLTGNASGEGATATLAIGAGNGITVNADDIAVKVQANKGLEVDANGVSLIDCTENQVLKYDGSGQWVCASDVDTGDGVGVTDIGTIDSKTKNEDGAVIDGTTLYLQTADASNAGLVSINDQTFAGAKTFSSQAVFSNGLKLANATSITSDGTFSIQVAADNNLTLATSGTGNLIFSGLNCSASGNGGKLTVDADGIVMCGDDTGGDGVGITSVTAGDDSITVGGTGNAPTVAINLNSNQGLEVTENGLGLVACADNQVLKYDADTSAWDCASDTDTTGITSIVEGDGIAVANGNEVSVKLQSNYGLSVTENGLGLLDTCSNNQILKYNTATTSWDCGDDVDTDTNTTGVTSIGTIDTGTASSDGASVSGSVLYLQSAAADRVGLVTISSQTFAGAKTFNAQTTFNEGLALAANKSITSSGALSIQAANDSNLTLTTSGTGAIILSGYNCSNSGGGGKLTTDATGKIICAADGDTDTTGITEIDEGDGISVNDNEVSINLRTNQGLEVDSTGLGLLSTCSNNQVLKYNTSSSTWGCADDIDTDTGITGTGSTGYLTKFDSDGNLVDSMIDGSTTDQIKLQAAGATATLTANTALTIAAGGTDQDLTLQGSGTGSVVVGSLLDLQGALKINVTSSNAILYNTPGNADVPTAINIPYYDPGAYGQIVAMGLPSTAVSTARVISLFDARTSAHQPTIAVFSPNESQVFGFSWEGSNTDAYVKSTGTSITLQPNSVNGLKVSSTGVTVQVTGTLSVSSTSTLTGLITAAGGLTTTAGNISTSSGTVSGSTINATSSLQTSGTTRINSSGVLQNVTINTTGNNVKASTATTSVLYTDSSGNIKQIASNVTDTEGTYCLITDGGNTVGFGDCPTSGSSYGEGRVSYDNTSTSDSLRWNPVSNAWGTYTIRIGGGSYSAASGDYLEYDLWCESGDCSPAVTNGDNQLGVDQNGIKNGITDMNNRTGADASSYASGRWYHRKISLTAGTSMSATYLRWAATGQSTAVFYFKNIHITNGSTIKKRIWDNGKPNGTLAIGGSGSRPCAGSCSSYGVEELRWDYQQAVDVSELSVFRNKLTVGCELYRNDSNSPYGTACTNNSSYTNGSSQSAASYIVQKTATFGVYGTIAATGTITASTTPDIAETIDAAPDVEAGDIVVPDPNNPERAIKSTKAYDSSVLGAISDGSGGFLINAYGDKREASSEDGLTGKPLVLAGRIKVKVSGENGAIHIGDPITTSATPGYGMKATRAGNIIGHALDNFEGDKGEVLVFLNLSYYNPDTDENIQSVDTENLQANAATIEALNVSGTATINELHVTSNAMIATLTVTGAATFSTVTVNGHIVTGGDAPDAAALNGATVTVDGNDTAGTVTVITGASSASGDLAQVTFNSGFAKVPRVILSGQDDASLAARVYPSSKSENGFVLKTEQILAPNTTYTYDYFVVQ